MINDKSEKEKISVTDITVSQVKALFPSGSYIDDDIFLFDNFKDVPFPIEPCRAQCLFLALCTSGKASYTVDTNEHTVVSGDVIIISEGQVVGDYLLSRDCDGIAIILSYPFFRDIISGVHELFQLFLFSRTHPVFRLNSDEMAFIQEYFHIIKRKVDDDRHRFRKELVCSIMKSLIYDVSNIIYRIQQGGDIKKTRAESIFTEFIKLVEANFREERRVGWYADKLCLTPKYLSESVKNVSKRRPNEWIDHYVTMEIRVLLKKSTMSIKEIAQQMHFANQSFLGKYFKDHVGVSPKEYRRS